MKKLIVPIILSACMAPLTASAQHYNNQGYRVYDQPTNIYYDRYGNPYYDNRGRSYTNNPYYDQGSYDRRDRNDRRDRYDRRDRDRHGRSRYDDQIVCRNVVMSDRNEGAAIAGAIIGGVLGNQVGSGSGRVAATLGGAVAGGYVGNEVGRDRHGNRIEQRCERVRY